MLGTCHIPERPRKEAPGAYLPTRCQGLNLLVPRTADQSFSFLSSRVSGSTICPMGVNVKEKICLVFRTMPDVKQNLTTVE